MIRFVLIAAALFANGFEARASSCVAPAKIDLGDGLRPVLLKPGTLSCVDGDTLKTQCVMDGVMCKRESAPLPPQPTCRIPAGFSVLEKSWADLWYGATWPNGISTPVPIGSFTSRSRFYPGGTPVAGKIITTKFVADAGNHRVSWVGAQAIPQVGYRMPQGADSVTVTVSECRADVYSQCRVSLRSGSLFYGASASQSACRTTAGRTYWLTFHFAQPDLSPATNTCSPENQSGGKLCDANFTAR